MPFNGNWKALHDCNTPQPEPMVCPACNTTYEWGWDQGYEGWWPGTAEWWHTELIDFLCSRKCYLEAVDWLKDV